MASDLTEVFMREYNAAVREAFRQQWTVMSANFSTKRKKQSQGEYSFMSPNDYKEFMDLCEEKEID